MGDRACNYRGWDVEAEETRRVRAKPRARRPIAPPGSTPDENLFEASHQCLGLLQTLVECSFCDALAFIVGSGALSAQTIENSHDSDVDVQRVDQRLYRGLVVTRLVRGGSIALQKQAHISDCSNRVVCAVETCLIAGLRQHGILQLPTRGGRDSLDEFRRGWNRIKLADLVEVSQVIRGHPRFPSGKSLAALQVPSERSSRSPFFHATLPH